MLEEQALDEKVLELSLANAVINYRIFIVNLDLAECALEAQD